MASRFLFPLIDKPTRVNQQSSTIIDNIYCSLDNLVDICQSGVFRFSISDHYAIFCINNSIKICDDNVQSSDESLIKKIFLDSSNVLENNHGYP